MGNNAFEPPNKPTLKTFCEIYGLPFETSGGVAIVKRDFFGFRFSFAFDLTAGVPESLQVFELIEQLQRANRNAGQAMFGLPDPERMAQPAAHGATHGGE